MILAVASGKGGTGKTTVAVNLARTTEVETTLLDCDVEEPNAHLFLDCVSQEQEIVHVPIPIVDEALCDGCGACGRFCEFNAIVSFGEAPLIFPELCHSCGGCVKVCPKQALRETDRRIGTVEKFLSEKVTLIQGRLDIGVAMAPPLIRAVRAFPKGPGDVIVDAPPGTSCPVMAAVREADFVLLVTEPTPFGLGDLKLAVDMVRLLGASFGVAINRDGSGDDRVRNFCDLEGIPLLASIPDDRRIAEAYSRGKLIAETLPEYKGLFRNLYERIRDLAFSEKSAHETAGRRNRQGTAS